MESIDLVQELSDAFGVAGFEDEVRERIEKLVSAYVDEVRTDTLGNLFATRMGKGDLTLMLDAHMDEIGFMVKWIDENGYLRFSPIGGCLFFGKQRRHDRDLYLLGDHPQRGTVCPRAGFDAACGEFNAGDLYVGRLGHLLTFTLFPSSFSYT